MKGERVNKGRRNFLKKAAVATGALAVPSVSSASFETPKPSEDWYAMLYDATKCIGCKTCMVACKRANGLPYEEDEDGLHDAPVDLSSKTVNIIKLYKEGDKFSFIKRQCMHCVDPTCVSVCPVGAMRKDPKTGIVYWDGSRCIGCRYCMMACPFNIPKFEWEKTFPKVVKCFFCKDTNLKEKGIPACCEVCPTGAVIFGKRGELLEEAKRRIRDNPGRYIPKVYGEKEVGGTDVFYLAGIEFAKLGLPELIEESPAAFTRLIHHGIYKTVAPPAFAFALLWMIIKDRDRE